MKHAPVQRIEHANSKENKRKITLDWSIERRVLVFLWFTWTYTLPVKKNNNVNWERINDSTIK